MKNPGPYAAYADAACFVGAFAALLFSAAPGRSWMDAGELGAAAVQLGVAHPTGFPVYLLGAKATSLLPAGELALRLNLFSALCGALACLLAARLCRALVPAPAGLPAGLFTAALVLCGTTFWTQANVIEVYAPSLAATLLGLVLLARVLRDPGDARALWLLAFAAGFATGLHATLRIAAVATLLALLAHADTRRLLLRNLGVAIAAFALGFAAELYLPLASARGPTVDWGAPATWPRWLEHLTAARIRRAFVDEIGVLDSVRLWHHLGVFAEQLSETITAVGLPLVAVGVLVALRRAAGLGLALGAILGADVAFAVLVNPMGLAERQTGLPAQVMAVLFVGVALGAVLGRTLAAASGKARGRRALGLVATGLVGALALGLLASAATTGLDEKLRQRDHGAADLVDATLSELPTSAVVFTRSDDLSAGVLYAQGVEAARPDLTHLVRQHVWDRRYVRRALRQLIDADAPLLQGDREARIRAQTASLTYVVQRAREHARTIAWESADDDSTAGVPLFPAGLLFQAEPLSFGPAPRPKLDTLLRASPAPTPMTRRYASLLWDRLGRAFSASPAPEATDRAESAFREAVRAAADAGSPWNNLAVLLSRRGRRIEAITAAKEATRHEPLKASYWANLGLFCLQAGDDGGADKAYRRATRLAPGDPRPAVGLGLLAARAGRRDEARRLLERALELGATGETRRDALINLEILKRP